MLATYPFSGSMDLDSPDLVMPSGTHRTARNGIFRGPQGRMRYEGVVGTTLIPNSLLPNTGTNVTIGAKYDPVRYRLYIFNYNSTGFHSIMFYDTQKQTFITLVQSGTNTQGDPLEFSPNIRIHSIDIIYGDENSGDLLFYVDSLQRCRKLNVAHLLNNIYTPIKDSYFRVISAPPVPPPQCVYENDMTVANNNVVNSLFKFSCTHIDDNYEETVLGSGAKQPLPSDPFDPLNNTPAYRNARIAIYVPTGDQNVTKIRIYGKQVKDGVTSDWFIVDTLIKADLGIADNTVYKYLFFNNGNYIPADTSFTTLDYDRVPQQAVCQGLLNGNVISYGAITEGYDFINPSFGILTQNTTYPLFSASGVLFFAALNGQFTGNQPQITIYLTGVGTNDGFGNPTDLEKSPSLLVVRAKSGAMDISFSYNNSGANRNIATLLFDLRGAATSAGWVYVSNTTNSLTLYYPTGNVVLQSSYFQGINADVSPYIAPVSVHYPLASYSYGVLYRDQDGRTNGVISNITGNIVTQFQGSANQIPEVLIGLGGFTPPLWAAYYEIVRTDNLTYNKYLNWVSGSAYSNAGAGVTQQYAYFGISNIDDYNTQIMATQGVIGYTFTSGDRIKVLGRYSANGSFVTLNYDYAILGTATNPLANGSFQNGNYIQIAYPSGDINPNFEFTGTEDFQNYLILIYSYAAHNASNQNVFWQIGQQYGIGNPGTNTAYHMGNVADNQVNLTDGDIFYLTRNVPIINTYYVNCGSFDQGTTYSTLWVNPGGGGTPIIDNGIWNIKGGSNRNAGLLATQPPVYSDTDWTVYNESATAFNVRLRQPITVIDKVDPNGQWALYIKVVASSGVTTYNVISDKTGLQPGIVNSYDYDITIPLPAGSKLWILSYSVNEMLIGGGQLRIDIIRTRTIQAYDASFSDIFNLKTNSDNKPSVIDTDAKETFFSTLFRYSLPYEPGTNINNTNRFYPDNSDEFDKSHGSIQRIRVRQREARIFQERRCGRVGVYQKFVTNNAGEQQLIVSDTIITPNNIQYYEGEWGIGNQPTSLCSSGFSDYFADPVKGYFCRLSLDGVIPISELYKIQTFAGSTLPTYLKGYYYQFGGPAVILGVYNFLPDRDGEAIFVMQAGSKGPLSFAGPDDTTITYPAQFFPGPATIPGQSIAFVEARNAFTAFYDFVPDMIVCCENILFSFYNGVMYTHDNTSAYATFYGQSYPITLTGIFKEPTLEKKNFLSLMEVSNIVWECPSIYTNTMSYGNIPQQSNLATEDFALLGADYSSGFWYDLNSQGGLLDGDTLAGNFISIQFQAQIYNQLCYLSEVSIKFTDNPLTAK